MRPASSSDVTRKIQGLVAANKVWIRKRHIEKDHIWRQITESDVRVVLSNGKVTATRTADQTIFWQGSDVDGRIIELLCSLVNEKGVDTLVVQDAKQLKVGTAYEPGKDDEEVREEWLKQNPDYEKTPDGRGVQRKFTVTKA